MSKVVFVKFGSKKIGRSPKSATVGEKRVRDAGTGKFTTVRTIEGSSKSFGKDLGYVFAKNVAKARRENKQVTGTTDRVPAKA